MQVKSLGFALWMVAVAAGCVGCGDDGSPAEVAGDAAVTSAPGADAGSDTAHPNGTGTTDTEPSSPHQETTSAPLATTGSEPAVADTTVDTGSGGAPTGTQPPAESSTSTPGPSETQPPHVGSSSEDGTSESTDANGGTFSGENAEVHIPNGAAPGNIDVTIVQGTDVAEDGEWTYYAAGNPVQFGPSGTTFSEPVEVTLTFSPEVVGGRPDLLVVAHRDDETQQVTFIHPDYIDGSHVTVSASSFSTFQPVMYRELLAGVVTDRNTSQPVPGAELFFYGSGYGNAIADANGVYSFTLENVTLFGGGLSGSLYVGSDGYFEAPNVAVSDLGSQPSLPVVNDFTLLPSGPLVTGTITDATSGSGIAGVSVTFTRTPMSTFRGGATTVTVTTDSAGNYAVDASFFAETQSGEFSVNLMVDVDGYLGTSKSLEFQGGPVVQDFALNSDAGTLLTGVVTDRETHQPIEGAEVFFYGSGYGDAVTDANGVYTFTADDLSSFGGGLTGTLYVGADGYFEAPPLSVDDLATQASLPSVNDVTLLPGEPLVVGKITDSGTELGIPNVRVSFNRSPMSTFRGGAVTTAVTTDSNGDYAIDASFFAENPSGEFTVHLMIDYDGYFGVTKDLELSLRENVSPDAGADAGGDGGVPGTTLEQDFALNSNVGPLMTGVVRNRNTNSPVVGAKVFFYGSGYGNAITDASGQYTFTIDDITSFGGALSGTLYIGTTGFFEAPPVSVSDLGSQPALPVVNDVTLLPGGAIVSGVVTDSVSGDPIDGAMVSFTRNPMCTYRGGAVTEQVATDSAGNYAIDASYFAENPGADFTVNLMVNATNYLGASHPLNFNGGPVVENVTLTPGVSQ